MAVSVAVILVLTLTPHPGAITVPPGFCIFCGSYGTANLIRNVVLFVPLGIGAGMVVGAGTSRRFLLGWLPAVGLTAGVELAQNVLPGRNPLLVDVVANAAGAAVGMLLVLSFVRGAAGGPATRRAVLRTFGWWVLSATALAGTALAFRLAPPPPPHFVQIQADLAQFERYEGAVQGVWVSDGPGPEAVEAGEAGEADEAGGRRSGERSGERLEIGRYPDPDGLVARVFGGARVQVDFEAGPPPVRIAPLFSLYSGAQREVFLLGVQGNDAVVRIPYMAATLGLDHPDHRIRGSFTDMEPGEPGALAFWRSVPGSAGPGDGGGCLEFTPGSAGEAAAVRVCGLRPTLGEGWTLLLFPTSFPPLLQAGMSWAWLLGLGFMPGLFAYARGAAVLAGVGLALVGGAAPLLLGSMAVLTLGQGFALVAGALLGWWGRAGLVACSTEAPASNPPHSHP